MELIQYNQYNTGTGRVSDVGSDRFWNTQGFLTKRIKEILWDHNFLSDVTGYRN